MANNTNNSFHKIIKSSFSVFVTTFISLFLGLFSKTLLIRFTTQEEYGLYSLALTIVTILITISTLGLENGATRCIAYYRGKNEIDNVENALFASIIISLISSTIVLMLVLFIVDGTINKIFPSPNLSSILRILSITIPFSVLINVFVAIFRGFDRTDIKIYFNDILKPFFYLILLIIAIHLNLSIIILTWTYATSIIITFIVLLIYAINRPPINFIKTTVINKEIIKEVFFFSAPLLVVNILLTAMSWTDTLMLGYLTTPKEVALYNAVYPIAGLLSTIINSLGFLYVPIISKLFAENQINELEVIYRSSTKWSFLLTLPLFCVLILYPELIIEIFFETRYVEASSTLQILAIGFVFNSYFGLNYYTLITANKSSFLLHCSLISAILNVILNYVLIPSMGIQGAAIASSISFILIEILITVKMYKFLKIHPFTYSYIKITFLSMILITLFSYLKNLLASDILNCSITMIFFMIVYVSLLIKFKLLDDVNLKAFYHFKKSIRSKK